ncbi:MAG: NAD(P)H-hydrate dehydratase, partial [Planctomycetota bacterium]
MKAFFLSKSTLPYLAKRPLNAHKGSFGHVLVVAGSEGMTGAGVLATLGAELIGAGLTTLAVPKSCLSYVAPHGISFMLKGLPHTKEDSLSLDALNPILELIQGKDVLVLGPGLSRHPETATLVRTLLGKLSIPTILDADALNSLEGYMHFPLPVNTILTHHPGEFRRLYGNYDPVQRIEMCYDYLEKWPLNILVLKGANTLVARKNEIYENYTGNPGMAVGGMGDILAGCIGGLLAQGLSAWDASRLAVYLHGLAGDLATKKYG